MRASHLDECDLMRVAHDARIAASAHTRRVFLFPKIPFLELIRRPIAPRRISYSVYSINRTAAANAEFFLRPAT